MTSEKFKNIKPLPPRLPATQFWGLCFIVFMLLQMPLVRTPIMFTSTWAHELGHGLGLGHENSVEAIMRSQGSDIEYPTADDIAGANFLYPASANISNSGNDGGGGGGCFIAVISGE